MPGVTQVFVFIVSILLVTTLVKKQNKDSKHQSAGVP